MLGNVCHFFYLVKINSFRKVITILKKFLRDFLKSFLVYFERHSIQHFKDIDKEHSKNKYLL